MLLWIRQHTSTVRHCLPEASGPMRYLVFLLAYLIAGPAVHASSEHFLEWSEVRVVGAVHGDIGRVVFTAEVRGDEWRRVEMEAFGKTFSLDAEQCEQLRGFPLSSLWITYEGGWELTGGPTVSFKFRTGFPALSCPGSMVPRHPC